MRLQEMGFALACLCLTHCGSPQQARSTTNAHPASGHLPETPGRVPVVDAMQAVTPAVQACGRIQHGEAQVRIVFDGPTGATTSVSVIGAAPGTPLTACIENAVRGAHLPPFRRVSFLVSYPFRF